MNWKFRFRYKSLDSDKKKPAYSREIMNEKIFVFNVPNSKINNYLKKNVRY